MQVLQEQKPAFRGFRDRFLVQHLEFISLEQLNNLTIDELDLLKETTDALIEHVERLKEKQSTTHPE